jgi:hypothetical protein
LQQSLQQAPWQLATAATPEPPEAAVVTPERAAAQALVARVLPEQAAQAEQEPLAPLAQELEPAGQEQVAQVAERAEPAGAKLSSQVEPRLLTRPGLFRARVATGAEQQTTLAADRLARFDVCFRAAANCHLGASLRAFADAAMEHAYKRLQELGAFARKS